MQSSLPEEEQEQIRNMIAEYQNQLGQASARIQALENEKNKQIEQQHSSEQEHNVHYENRIEELLEEKNHLIGTINEMHEQLQKNQHQILEYQK